LTTLLLNPIIIEYDNKKIDINKYLNDSNVIRLTLNNYSDINIDLKNIYLIKIDNNLSFDTFYNNLKDFNLNYSINGINYIPNGNIKYSDYINNIEVHKDKYIFNMITTKFKIELIHNLIPVPNLLNLKFIHIYSGYKYTGSHLHSHGDAFNHLIKGKKLWIIININETDKFNNLINNLLNNKLSIIDWYIYNIEDINNKNNEYNNISIFIQNEGETVFIPKGYCHYILNLENII
jgi:hypothetical protein